MARHRLPGRRVAPGEDGTLWLKKVRLERLGVGKHRPSHSGAGGLPIKARELHSRPRTVPFRAAPRKDTPAGTAGSGTNRSHGASPSQRPRREPCGRWRFKRRLAKSAENIYRAPYSSELPTVPSSLLTVFQIYL